MVTKNLRLILEVLSDFASGEVPDLNEAIHGASDKVLAILREPRALSMRLLSELPMKRHRFRMRPEKLRLNKTTCEICATRGIVRNAHL